MRNTLFKISLACLISAMPMTSWAQSAPAADAQAPAVADAADSVAAQATAPSVGAADQVGAPTGENAASEAAQKSVFDDPNLKPREIYNLALQKLQASSFDEAVEGFMKARDLAGFDNELRFNAAYNLGMTYAAQADAQGDPNTAEMPALQAAVEALNLSSAWFRDAIRQRPSIDEARQNLEIVLKRIVAINDIMQKKYFTLEKQIEEVLASESEIRHQTRTLSEQMQQAGEGADVLQFKSVFDAIAKIQRSTLTQANLVAENAADALNEIKATPEEQRSQEQAMRAFQLEMATPILEQARQTMAHARRQLRDQAMSDAWRLTNGSYNLLKQALEQFEEPLAKLQHLMEDESDFVHLAATRALLTDPVSLEALKAQHPEAEIALPNWLNLPLLVDNQTDVLVRTKMLAAMLEAMVEGAKNQLAQAQQADPQQKKQLEEQTAQIADALPLIQQAVEAMEAANARLSNDDTAGARDQGAKALKLLSLAAERFADLKHLIELAYASQTEMTRVVAGQLPQAAASADPDAEQATLSRDQQKALLSEALTTNLDRLGRMSDLLAKQAAEAMNAPTQDPNQPQQQAMTEEQKQQMQQLFERAEELRKTAEDAVQRMNQIVTTESVDAPEMVVATEDANSPAWSELTGDAEIAEKSLEELRILFFSVVEHVAELLRQQAKTMDQTTEAAVALDQFATPTTPIEPILERQKTHEFTADKLAEILQEQSQKMQQGEGAQAMDQNQQADAAQRYSQASSELQVAATAMRQVYADLSGDEKHAKEALEGQQTALEHIQAALELLQPPQQQQNQDQQQQDQQDQQQQNQDQQQQQQQQMSKEQAEKKIQQIRQREQERRKEREQRAAGAMPMVEKDW